MKNKILFSIICLSSTALISCGGTSSSSGSGSSTSSGLNIPGKVTSDNGTSSLGFQKLSVHQKVGKFALSGCSVKALSLSDSQELAATTTDTDGNYNLNSANLKEGENYKITASCGASKFVSVGKAVNKSAAEITDNDRVATNPRSTIISAFIIKAVVEAISDAVSSIPDPVIKNSVKDAIFLSMDAIIASIQSNVNEAINSGAMPEPSAADATAIAPAVGAADPNSSSAGIDDSLTNASVETPASVTQAIDGAKSSVSSLGACSSTAGSLPRCIQSIAKIVHNTLNFNILIAKTGAFKGASTISTCSGAHVVDSSVSPALTLADVFANSDIVEANSVITGLTDFCMIISKRSVINRNQGYEDGGDDGGPTFSESGNFDGITGSDTGLITSIGTSMFSGHKYNLQSLNNFVFKHQNGAGLNGRLINKRRTATSQEEYYYLEAGTWQNAGWPTSNGQLTRPYDLDVTFSSLFEWSSITGNDAATATAVGSSEFYNKGVFQELFGGDIPSQEELDASIDEERVHEQHNISGPKELYVLTTDFPGHGDPTTGANPCFDDNPLTNCKDTSGNDLAPVSVSLTLSAADPSTGLKIITAMDGTGSEYYLRPIYSHKGFGGVMGLVRAVDGRIARNELFQQRAVKVVLNQASECNTNSLPATGAGCADGNIYNAVLDWSACDGGNECPGYTAGALISASGVTVTPQNHYNHVFENNHRLLAVGFDGDKQKIKVTVNSGVGDDALVYAGVGPAGSGEYNLALYEDCSSVCTAVFFILIDDTGAAYLGDSDATLSKVSYNGGSSDVNVYELAHLNSGNDFDPESGTQTVEDVAVHRNINNGPVPSQNHKCENEPFFVDGNSNGKLDCGVQNISFNGSTMQLSVPIGGDTSFSNAWDYDRWANDPSLSGSEQSIRLAMPLIARDNAYFYEDPIGTKSLLSLAFNGWFDGSHVLNDSTELDALQAFSLTFLFFTGGDEKHLDQLNGPQDNKFEAVLPMDFSDEPGFLKALNEGLGKSFTEYKTN